MTLLTSLGDCEIHWGDQFMALKLLDTVVVPAGLEDVVLSGDAKVMAASLPDREALRQELGYRAENVAGLMD